MPDNLKRRQPEDPTRINVNEAWELDYWSEALGVTKEKLKAAVAAVGPSASAVRRHLGK